MFYFQIHVHDYNIYVHNKVADALKCGQRLTNSLVFTDIVVDQLELNAPKLTWFLL